MFGNKGKHVSPAGVEWSTGAKSGAAPQEFHQRTQEEGVHGMTFLRERPLTPEEEEARQKVVSYLQSYGLLSNAEQSIKGLVVMRDTDGWTRIMHGGGLWSPEFDRLTIDTEAPLEDVAHEHVHAFSRNSVHKSNVEGRKAYRMGLERGVMDDEIDRSFFNLLNETITDEIAIRALDVIGENNRPRERQFLQNLIRAMVEKGNKELDTEDKVWKEFLLSYMNGITPALKKSLRDTFGSDALRILAYAHEHDFDEADEGLWGALSQFFSNSISEQERKSVGDFLLGKLNARSK